ncbi:ClpP/crotonase, partial [Aureobasidium melanogenum]
MSQVEQEITLETRGHTAIITLNIPKKLNALNGDHYFRLAKLMKEVAAMDNIYITVLTGKGRFFSAGADVSISKAPPKDVDVQRHYLQGFVAQNLHITHAFYTHPKILIVALNGPAVGLSAALTGFADFVYAAPHTFILTPFSSLGLVAEGGSSRAFVSRLGISKANEALIMSKKLTCEELVNVGYVNGVMDVKPGEDAKFLDLVLQEVDDRLGKHLVPESLMGIKKLIRRPERELLDAQGVAEVFGGLERFVSGVPQEEFRKIASGEKKHKL